MRLRISGSALMALARVLDTPVAGRQLSERLMRRFLLDRLRSYSLPDSEARPVVVFRAAPKAPDG